MSGYINLIIKSRKTKVLLAIQVLIFISMMIMFLIGLPWTISKPISEYPISKYEKPPEWAQYYGINHGEPYFFRGSLKEHPIRFWFFFSLFWMMYLFMVMSMIYVYRINNEKFPWFKIKLYERKSD